MGGGGREGRDFLLLTYGSRNKGFGYGAGGQESSQIILAPVYTEMQEGRREAIHNPPQGKATHG